MAESNDAASRQATGREQERALVARVLVGDQRAARELYDAHADNVFKQALRRCQDVDRSRDLTQESFIRVFSRLSGFRGDSALSSWVYRVAHSVIANAHRQERVRAAALAVEQLGADATDAGGDVDHVLRDRLHAAIRALPPIYRRTLIMHDLEGYTHGDISRALGVPIGTSKSRLMLARRRVRAALPRVLTSN